MQKNQSKTVDEYIKPFPKNVREILEKVRQTIKRAAPGAEETISYQMPTFKLNGKYLVYFAAWKNHVGFYPMPSAIQAFKKELAKYEGAKGSVQFPFDKPVPYGLIGRMVKFRVKERLKQAGNKKNI